MYTAFDYVEIFLSSQLYSQIKSKMNEKLQRAQVNHQISILDEMLSFKQYYKNKLGLYVSKL